MARYGVITDCIKANMYAEPSSDSEIIGSLPFLERVLIIGNDINMIRVCASSGAEGYVSKAFIQEARG